MGSLFDILTDQLGHGGTLDAISGQLGVDRGAAKKAVPMALASLMGGLAGNAAKSGGAEALMGALSRDHDGSILDDVGGFLGQAESGPGAGILKHVLGGKSSAVEAGIGQQSGLQPSQVSGLLKMLAPIVLGQLGKQQRSGQLDAGGLRDLLGGERQRIQERVPNLGGLGGLLDADGDGKLGAGDAVKIGGGLLKNFLGRGR